MISPVKIWRRQKEIRKNLNRKGTIVTWTLVYVPAGPFKAYAPYPVVMVQFEDGSKAFGQLVDWKQEDLEMGKSVISVLRKVREGTSEDVISYGLKFKPE